MTERTRVAANTGQWLDSRVPSLQIASSDTFPGGQPLADHFAGVDLTEQTAYVN
jgi:hypothetical protein